MERQRLPVLPVLPEGLEAPRVQRVPLEEQEKWVACSEA